MKAMPTTHGLLACTILLVAFSSLVDGRRRLQGDVEVFQRFGHSQPSQSVSAASDARVVERFRRQLSSVHDGHVSRYQNRKPVRTDDFDDGYSKFFHSHFGQDYQKYEPDRDIQKENEKEADTHSRLRTSSNYQRPKSRQVAAAPRKKPDDVEEYQPDYGFRRDETDYRPSDEYERIKALSEQQAKEIQENPSNCKSVTKGEMECQICHNPKTGAKSESCSYASKPHSQKYAYVKEKKYDSKDDKTKKDEEDSGEGDENDDEGGSVEEEKEEEAPKKPLAPKANPQKSQQLRQARRQRIKRGNSQEKQPAESRKEESYDEYFSRIFPEYQRYEQSKDKSGESDNDDDYQYEFIPSTSSHKQDVEKALAEFKTKDWSSCKKIEKNGLTCYECKDKSGAQHEECMYVSHSSPKSSRLTYTENDEYHSNDEKDDDDNKDNQGVHGSESRTDKQTQPAEEESGEKPEPPKKKTTTKLSRKVVVKKRKVDHNNLSKVEPISDNSEEKPIKFKKPFNGIGKRVVRKKVTIKMATNKHGDDVHLPEESRVIYFDQKYEHSDDK